ncbi:MAG TPA: M28 family peptidase [Terriglobales bacterium]|nr:M28 family peptidase [Terriglobales bacterium]
MKRQTLLAFLLCIPLLSFSQSSPFLSEDVYRKLVNEISGAAAYDHLRTLTQFHAPNGSGRGFKAQAQWVAEKAKEAGLEDVRIIDLPYEGIAWTPGRCELWLLTPAPDNRIVENKLISCADTPTAIADNSRPAKLEADLVDVGEGIQDRDYDGKDVKGKVVLASGRPSLVESQAVWKRGALGIVSYWSSRITATDYPDQVQWSSVHEKADKDGKEPAFAIMVSPRMGIALRHRLYPHRVGNIFQGEREVPAEALRVRVLVESEIATQATQQIVEGWIRGSRIHDQQIVLTSHMQEEKTSANDDRSGVANMLEIGRALKRLITEGKLKQPQRDIRFWWTNEIQSEYDYFAQNAEERKKTFANINQDMVGAAPNAGSLSRMQHVTRTPWSRPTFFNDVVESIVTALYQGNNSYIAALSNPESQTGFYAPGTVFTRPVFSTLGARDRYPIEVVPYFPASDHIVFNDAMIGTKHGGVTFTNWPDEYIHSSADDTWQVDPTMLKRNGVAVAAITWYMANAGERYGNMAVLTSTVLANGIGRVYRDARNAFVAEYAGATKCENATVRQAAVERELGALESIKTLFPGDVSLATQVSRAQQTLQQSTQEAIFGLRICDDRPPAALRDSLLRVPKMTTNVAEYVKKSGNLKPPQGLGDVLTSEALNFADGKRSIWNIYGALRAESLATGEWYYGTVTPAMVNEFFENAAKAGIVSFAGAPATAAPKASAGK